MIYCQSMSKPNVPLSLCHQCGASLDAACLIQKTGQPRPDKVKALPGDISVCIYCGCIHKFDQDVHLRKATKGDLTACMLSSMETYETLMKAQEAILLFLKQFPDFMPKRHTNKPH